MGNEPGQQPDEPHEDAIRERAHQIWVNEGMPDGRAEEHWLRARWELEKAPGPKAELDELEPEDDKDDDDKDKDDDDHKHKYKDKD